MEVKVNENNSDSESERRYQDVMDENKMRFELPFEFR